MIRFKDENRSLKELDSVSLAEMLRAHFVDNYPAPVVQKLSDSIQVASYLHRTDVRRGGRGSHTNPAYIEHPLRVAIRLVKYFNVSNSDVIIAAILHDTVEDRPFEFSDFEGVGKTNDEIPARRLALEFISHNFGYEVAKLVDLVSNPITVKGLPKEDKLDKYHTHVVSSVRQSQGALIVKVSDFVDNAGSLHHHYKYGDPKVQYFIQRYSPLIDVYEDALIGLSTQLFDVRAAHERVLDVRAEFNKFKRAS